jgi:hypothetical protein
MAAKQTDAANLTARSPACASYFLTKKNSRADEAPVRGDQRVGSPVPVLDGGVRTRP